MNLIAKALRISLLVCIIAVALFLTACKPYTVEGTIVGKVYEPAHTERTIQYPMSRTEQVGDKWYVEIAFTDKGGQLKTFDWGVTKEAYGNYKVGDKTPVNVEGGLSDFWIFIALIMMGVVYAGYSVLKKVKEKEEVKEIEYKKIKKITASGTTRWKLFG